VTSGTVHVILRKYVRILFYSSLVAAARLDRKSKRLAVVAMAYVK